MSFSMEKMNNSLFKEWLVKYTSLESYKEEILFDIIKKLDGNLSFLYKVNEALFNGEGYVFKEDKTLEFQCKDGYGYLHSSNNSLSLDKDKFRDVIGTMIDIYEDVYPLGTVVDLKKNAFKDVLPVDKVEYLRVVINYRFIPCSKEMYMPYMGAIYPIGSEGVRAGGVHFTTKAIERVVHMGYRDEQEVAYLYKIKKDMILNKNMHSTAFMRREEIKMFNNK